jgi:hypothetical protein
VNLLRGLAGHLLDVYSPGGRDHDYRFLALPVDDDPDVGLGGDILAFGHQNLLDRKPLDLHTQNLRGHLESLIRVVRLLDAAGLASSSHVYLSFHHDRLADPGGNLFGLVRGGGHLPGRKREVVPGEYLFGLIFVYLHLDSFLYLSPHPPLHFVERGTQGVRLLRC